MPAKRDVASGIVVDRLQHSVVAGGASAEGLTPSLDNESRRNFLRRSGTARGRRIGERRVARRRGAARSSSPRATRGSASRFPRTTTACRRSSKSHVRRRRTDVLKNRQNFSDWSMTPLQHQHGIITPNGLILRAASQRHAGHRSREAQARDPRHGAGSRSSSAMDDLLRYPSVSKFYFIGVLGQRPHRLAQGRVHDRAADARAPVVRAMDRHSGVLAARRGRTAAGARNGCCSRAPTAPATRAACRSRRCSTTA